MSQRARSETLEEGHRILVDALPARFGGTAYATVQLARRLIHRPEVESVAVLTRSGSIVERGLPRQGARLRCISLPSGSRLELLRRIGWTATCLPRMVRREGFTVLISMSGMLARPPSCPVVCVLLNPVMYERTTAANLVRRWAVRRTGNTAARMAAPSRMLAELVTASVGRDCGVLPLGVDHSTFAPVETPGREILCVADFYAHKRHDLVLDTWLQLPSPRPALRFIGNPAADPSAHARLLMRIAELPEKDSIAVEHEISLSRLVSAYHAARVFLLASEHESFCMPLVESMACGVPPVVRGLTSLRETGGAGAVYVDGDDRSDWAAAVSPLLEDETRHADARRAAVRAGERFSWDKFAEGLLDGFRRPSKPRSPSDVRSG